MIKEIMKEKKKEIIISVFLELAFCIMLLAEIKLKKIELDMGATIGLFSIIIFAYFLVENIFLKKLQTKQYVAINIAVSSTILFGITQLFVEGYSVHYILISIMLNYLFNIFVLILISTLIYLLTKSIRLSINIPAGILLIIGTIDFYIYSFTGREISPFDILSIGAATHVVGNGYKFIPKDYIIFVWIMFIAFFAIVFQMKKDLKVKNSINVSKRIIASVVVLGVLIASTKLMVNKTKIYELSSKGTKINGLILNLVSKVEKLKYEKPEGYSLKKIEEIANKYKNDTEGEKAKNEEKKTDIIVVVNESYADLGKLGNNFKTNEEVTPFINSLKENTTKGYTLSSIFAGNTPNTEYEFLTGNTMSFFPKGSIPFNSYVLNNQYSLLRHLQSKGYYTLSMHPEISTTYSRINVYPYIGFNKSLYKKDFPNKSTLRNLITDDEVVDTIIKNYKEESKKHKNVFIYAMTMQNHGGYTYDGADFKNEVSLEGFEKKCPLTEQYLTCLKATDKAIEKLINYFKNSPRDVEIVFFGDHQPQLDEQFYEQVKSNTKLDENEEKISKYEVPYFIWTNYKSEEKEIELTSNNYLGLDMLDIAGIEQPVYGKFLKEVRKTIPYINSQGYYSNNKKQFIDITKATGKEKQILDQYNSLVYNSQISKEKNDILFPEK